MYYPCSENKDADQLRGYREADLRLCFRPYKLLVFSRTGSYRKMFNLVDLGFNVPPTAKVIWPETGPRFIVSSDRLEKPEIEPVTLGLQGE